MKRRDFVVGAVSFAAVTRVAAQPVANSRRLAIVDVSTSHLLMHEDSDTGYRVLFAELRRLGQIEGQNLTVERYGKEQNLSDAAALAAPIVRSTPDLIHSLISFPPFFYPVTLQ